MTRSICIMASVAWLASLLSGCPAHTLLSEKQQAGIQKTHQGKTYFLKYSQFIGPFYEYSDRLYTSERAFDERVLLQSPSGEPILPAKPTGVLPMGTRVRIKKIEFPTASVVSARKLHSPRHFTWIFLETVGGECDRPLVMVMTQELRNRKQFEQALAKTLLDEDPRPAFEGRRSEVLWAIDHKTLVQGMRVDALMRSRGYPDKIQRHEVDGARVEKWYYAPKRFVLVRDDVVESWQGFEVLDFQKPKPQADAS